jgi:outer membrane protein
MSVYPSRLALLSLVAVLSTLAAASARAADHEGADRGAAVDDGSRWGAGLGVAIRKSPYKGVDNNNGALPLFSFENDYLLFFGTTLDAKLPSLGDFDFSLRTKVSVGGGYKASKSPYLAGMDSRNGAVWFGGATTWHAGVADLSLDFLDSSKGSQLQLEIERSFMVGKALQVTPHASVTRFDAKYVDYYFGVKAAEARPDRPAYTGTSGLQTDFGVRFAVMVTPHQRLLIDAYDTRSGQDITDSPLVAKKSIPAVIVGYTYNF